MLESTGDLVKYPLAIHAWDNTPRSGRNGLVLEGSNPEHFRSVLRRALDARSDAPSEERLVFLKSWNELAEGNHLEPDLKFGHGYLEVIRQELAATGGSYVRNRLRRCQAHGVECA